MIHVCVYVCSALDTALPDYFRVDLNRDSLVVRTSYLYPNLTKPPFFQCSVLEFLMPNLSSMSAI